MRKKIFLLIACACCLLCMACASSAGRTDTAILDYQRQIDSLENELNSRDRAIENGIRRLEGITERCTIETGTIDEVIKLFDEYQRGIEQLLYDYYRTDPGVKTKDTDNKLPVVYTYNKTCWDDYWLYYLRKRDHITKVAGHSALAAYENYSYYFTSFECALINKKSNQ